MTDAERVDRLHQQIWVSYFKKPIDQIAHFSYDRPSGRDILRRYFFDANWNEVFDLIEFVLKNCEPVWRDNLYVYLNRIPRAGAERISHRWQ